MPSSLRLLSALAALWCTAPAAATLITLSTHSSDETNAGVLDASMDFDVSGMTLTLTVENLTSGSNTYNINELFFNVDPGSGVLGLQLDSGPANWSFSTDQMANGFGVFDFALMNGTGVDPDTIFPGETVVFSFTILGSGAKADFVNANAVTDLGFRVAAKFVAGPDDDSAWGATIIPAPGAVALLAAGALTGRRRRRRS